jgi:hypothetical protein
MMPKVLKWNAVAVFILAALFYGSFMFAKHDPAFRDIIPFGEDPYDAVGSFGVIVAMLIALLSLARAFRPLREAPSAAQLFYLVRSQQAVVLAVVITLSADAVAMARHASMWTGAASRDRLIALLGGITTVAIAVQLLVRASQRTIPQAGSNRWIRAAMVTLLILLVLADYPEQLIGRLPAHLLTVVVGAIVLIAPMRFLLIALVPDPACEERMEKRPSHGKFSTAGRRWTMVVLVGILIGASAFMGEIAEGSGASSIGRLVFVASVFIGLGFAGILIAYAFLAKPLGLEPRAETDLH